MRRIWLSRHWNGTRLALLAVIATVVLSLAACGAGGEGDSTTPEAAAVIAITDDGGREVAIPAQVDKVFCTSPVGTYLVYTLAPDMLAGWNIRPSQLEQEYIPEEYRPVVGLGGWFGKNTTGNVEEIIKTGPDLILSVGDIDESAISDAERVQDLLGIPVVLVEATLATTGDSYRFIGGLLGVEERAEELADYSDQIIAKAQQLAAHIPEGDRVTIYYAEGAKGLYTDPEGSSHTEVFSLVGARNVAEVALDDAFEGYGMSPVSLEQVIAWDPQYVFVASDPEGEMNVYDHITTGGDWDTIEAVKNGHVYQIPHGPFDWLDRPYSIARMLGIQWVGKLLYPEQWDIDIRETTKEFYRLFYHYELSETQFEELTTHALAAPTETTEPTETTDRVFGGGVEVRGLVDAPTTLAIETLETMTVLEITADHPKLGPTIYKGVLLSELFATLGVQPGATAVTITANDGYMVEILLTDIAASGEAMLAIGADGSLTVVIPGMEAKNWVKDVATMEFK